MVALSEEGCVHLGMAMCSFGGRNIFQFRKIWPLEHTVFLHHYYWSFRKHGDYKDPFTHYNKAKVL